MLFTKPLGLIFYLLNTSQMMATFCSLLTCLTCIKFLRDAEQQTIVQICAYLKNICYVLLYLDKVLGGEGKGGFYDSK